MKHAMHPQSAVVHQTRITDGCCFAGLHSQFTQGFAHAAPQEHEVQRREAALANSLVRGRVSLGEP